MTLEMFKSTDPVRVTLSPGSWYDYWPNWMSDEDADSLQSQLTEDLDWEQREIVVFSKSVMQPRLITWAGEVPYRYSGQTLEPKAWPESLARLKAAAEEATGAQYNHALLNLYRNGHDNMGLHSDNERELGRDPVIAALSLGVARRFVFESRDRRRKKRKLQLEHGSLLVMGGSVQHSHRHAVPKQKSVLGSRINVTFRMVYPATDPSRR